MSNGILETSFEINTVYGIMANMPVTWWDSPDNFIKCVEHTGSVTVYICGDKKTVLQWLFNLGADGRYKLFPNLDQPKHTGQRGDATREG